MYQFEMLHHIVPGGKAKDIPMIGRPHKIENKSEVSNPCPKDKHSHYNKNYS